MAQSSNDILKCLRTVSSDTRFDDWPCNNPQPSSVFLEFITDKYVCETIRANILWCHSSNMYRSGPYCVTHLVIFDTNVPDASHTLDLTCPGDVSNVILFSNRLVGSRYIKIRKQFTIPTHFLCKLIQPEEFRFGSWQSCGGPQLGRPHHKKNPRRLSRILSMRDDSFCHAPNLRPTKQLVWFLHHRAENIDHTIRSRWEIIQLD